MSTVFEFQPGIPITLPVRLKHIYEWQYRFLLDTGAVFTVITPNVAVSLGYELSQLKPTTEIFGVINSKLVPKVTIPTMKLFAYEINDIEATVIDLSPKLRLDGLLGLNALKHFNLNLEFGRGILTLERI
jgi:predicted aspartyl protease